MSREAFETPVWITGVKVSHTRRATTLRVLNTRDLTVCVVVPTSLIARSCPSSGGASSFEYLVPQWLAHKHKLTYTAATSSEDVAAYEQRRQERRTTL